MALACQKDSYLKEFDTKVKCCTPAEANIAQNGKKEVLKGFEVILEDTVLFPEGGGQPDDRGKINDIPVLQVSRRGADAIHFVTTEIVVGSDVHVTVDWTRRFDHMQQHSGQHLITAMAENMYGYVTTTWNLGEKTSFIELDTPSMSVEEMNNLERALNEKIREGVKVIPTLYHDKNDPELEKARCRGLPDDHVGPVRVLTIEDIDSCLCCGTHVSNASDLQVIKLLSTEKGKRKKSTNLNFVCGNRVLAYLGKSVDVEKSLTVLLKGPIDQHFELAEKYVKTSKASQKTIKALLKDVACLEGEKFRNQENKPPFFVYHRKEGDIDFSNTLLKEIKDENVLAMVIAGEDKGPASVIIAGPEPDVREVGPKIMELIDGKGDYSNGRFQGKTNKLQNRTKAARLIEEYVANNKQ